MRPLRVILGVPGSEVGRWRRSALGAFDVVKATSWAEALAETRIDVGFVFFHLAERMGLRAATGRSTVHENPGNAGPRHLVTSPRLPSSVTCNSSETIERHVLEALAAVAAYDEQFAPSEPLATIGFMESDLGGRSGLSIEARARAVAEAVAKYHALLGGA